MSVENHSNNRPVAATLSQNTTVLNSAAYNLSKSDAILERSLNRLSRTATPRRNRFVIGLYQKAAGQKERQKAERACSSETSDDQSDVSKDSNNFAAGPLIAAAEHLA